ncbi:MAG: hypothetical protein ACR2FO_02535 [Actinomycetota bacterium]
MQIVYLTNRPALLAGTISFVRAHLTFIDNVLVVTPSRFRAELNDLGIDVIADEDLVLDSDILDHQGRNYALRCGLAASQAVDDVFLMSDDDSRPLTDIEETSFLMEGRYRRYTFGWLDDWSHKATAFDAGQHSTRQILGLYHFPRLSYASHMPQIIDKALLSEVVELLSPVAQRSPLCEWSTYFNIAPALHPDRFHEPEPFVTLGWPENFASWQPSVEPGAFLFENHFPEHYGGEGVFGNIDPEDHSIDASVDKVLLWRTYELELLAGEREPIVGGQQPMGGIHKALRRARAAAVGDPIQRDRNRRAEIAALLRAIRRP